MAHFIRSFSRRLLPDRLHEISERVYVFECCLSRNEMSESEFKAYMEATVADLQKHRPGASYMVFNFHVGDDSRSHLSDILCQHDMITVVDYPLHYESYPLVPLEMIHYLLKSSNSWLSLEGEKNVIIMHCEQGCWPVLAFMLAGLLLYSKKCIGEQKTLEMVHKHAAKELLTQFCSVNPSPSQIRYLKYVSDPDWPYSDAPLVIDSLVLMNLPLLDGDKGCRPVIQIYGLDPSVKTNRTPQLLFSSLSSGDNNRYYHKEECLLVKVEINQHVQGDVFLECIHLGEDLVTKETIFRVMFHTAFVQSNILILGLDEIDALWDAKSKFPKDFKAEVLFSSFKEGQASNSTLVATEQEEESFYESESEFFEVEEFDILDSDDHYIENWRNHSLPDNYIIEDLGNDGESESGFRWTRNPDVMFSVESFKELPPDDHGDEDDEEGNSDASSVENIVIIDKTEKTDLQGDEEAITKSKHVVVLAVMQEHEPELPSDADYEPNCNPNPDQDSDQASDIDELHPNANDRQANHHVEVEIGKKAKVCGSQVLNQKKMQKESGFDVGSSVQRAG